MIAAVLRALPVLHGSGTPYWVSIVAGIGSGLAGAAVTYWHARRLFPSQKRELQAQSDELEARLTRNAVQTVESAMNVARERIDTLERQVADLTEKIADLRARLNDTSGDRERLRHELDLVLSERAKLQQQISDLLDQMVGGGRMVPTRPREVDAVVIMNMSDGKISYASDGVFGLFGYPPEDLLDQPIEMLVPEADRSIHKRDRAAYLERPVQRAMGHGQRLGLSARTKNGDTIKVDISLHPTGDERVIALVKRR